MPDENTAVLEVGIREIDVEHSLQVRFLKGMENAIAASDHQRAIHLLKQLYNYSEVHFGTEQVFMRLHAYPASRSHEREHGELLTQLREMIDAADAGEAADLASWPKTLRHWLIGHINKSDMAFAEWVRAEEQRATRA